MVRHIVAVAVAYRLYRLYRLYTVHAVHCTVHFTGGNWMWFEIGLRDFAVDRGLDLEVYTGTEVSEVCTFNWYWDTGGFDM